MPWIREVCHEADAAEELAHLPPGVVEACYEQLQGLRDRDLATGTHVELLLVDGHAIRVNLFVDTDGTLWIERLGAG